MPPPPTPMVLASLSNVFIPWSAVVRDDPPGYDEHRYEQISSHQSDTDLLDGISVPPWRVFPFFDQPSYSLGAMDAWNQINSTGNFWWNQQLWGAKDPFDWSGSAWQIDTSGMPVGNYPYACAGVKWDKLCFFGSQPLRGNDAILWGWAVQVIYNPAATVTQNYQIWTVTGWGWNPPTSSCATTGPVSPPWNSSSDFAMVSSGTLNPGDIVTITPHDFSPTTNCQIPPAPTGTIDSDWTDWAKVNYLAFV